MKILISLSGGLDSTSLLAYCLSHKMTVECVSFTYGSKHNKYENQAAQDIATYYDVNLTEIDITPMMINFKSDLLQTGGKIPEGHYQAENMKSTVVPARNMIFISIMTGLAISKNCDNIAIGVHAGDHFIYPDCRPNFIKYMSHAVHSGSDKTVNLTAPWLFKSKAEIIKKALSFVKPIPFHLTRTCYKDQEIACGKCGSCVERLEAFKLNSMTDPIKYK